MLIGREREREFKVMLTLPVNNDTCAAVLLGNWAWTFTEQVENPIKVY